MDGKDHSPAGTKVDDPFTTDLGIAVETDSDGMASAVLEVEERHLNFHGTVHGGAVYSLADAAFAAASNAGDETAVSLEANVSYLRTASVGDRLVATTEATYLGARTAEYSVPVANQQGDRIATFRGRVYKPRS